MTLRDSSLSPGLPSEAKGQTSPAENAEHFSRFLTHEIGSLAKPPWLVKTNAGRPLEESDVEHARSWGEKVGVDGHEELVEKLQRGGADKDELGRWASRYALRLLESAGLEVVFDGEQQRSEMYAWAVDHSDGFAPRGTVR